MKGERLLTMLQSAILAFLLSFGAIGCLLTAFPLEADLGAIALLLAGVSCLGAVCFGLKLGAVPGALVALVCGYYWRLGDLTESFYALAQCLNTFYSSAYGWGNLTPGSGSPMMALCLTGTLVSLSVSWTVCRRRRAFWAVAGALIPVGACCVVIDTMPSAVFLSLVFVGIGILLLSQGCRRKDARQGNRLAALVSIPVAVACLLLMVVFPRDDYKGRAFAEEILHSLQGYFESATGGQSPTEVSLGEVGPKVTPRVPVMKVTVTGKSGTIYLRGTAYDQYDGKSWNFSNEEDPLFWPTLHQLDRESAYTVKITTERVLPQCYLPYYIPQGTVPAYIGNGAKETEFDYPCWDMQDPVRVFQYNTRFPGTYCLTLPEDTEAWAEALLEELVAPGENPVKEIAEYVKASASYSLRTGRMPAEEADFARWFLEESDTGYCVHFATAATVLLRAAGIPARYVTGYMFTARAGKTATVYESDAHAWVEYWQEGIGWQILEATPAAETVRPGAQQQTPPVTPPVTTPVTENPAVIEKTERNPWVLQVVLWVAVAALLIGAVILQWRLRRGLRRKGLSRGHPNKRAVACWREVTLRARLLNEKPEKRLYRLAQKAKYSNHTLTDAELAEFDGYLREQEKRLKAQPLLWRVLYALIWAV